MRAVITLVCAVALAGCVANNSPTEPGPITRDPTVTLKNVSYEPPLVTVEPGTVVTWDWDDGSIQHDVVFDDFRSEIKASGSFQHTFAEPGTYEYFCSLHPNMTGTVHVVDETE